MGNKLGINGVGQIALAVSDIKRSVEFYQNTLGLKLLFETHEGPAFFQCGNLRLMLTPLQGNDSQYNTPAIYYEVEDVRELSAQVPFEKAVELAAHTDTHEVWIGFIKDPDDNLIGLMSNIAC